MADKRIALDLAAFLDSAEARALEVPAGDVRKIARAFLAVSYDELGKAPHLLDGQDVHEALGHRLPGHFGRKDPLAEHVPGVLAAFLDHLEATRVVAHAFEVRRGLEETLEEFRSVVETGEHAHAHPPARQAPLVHRAPKLGRNEPCFCGSGKKFKKCHGQAGA